MANYHSAYTLVDGKPYESPKTHVGRAPHTLAEHGENFIELAKEFYSKVVAEFAARKVQQQQAGLQPHQIQDHTVEFVVDNQIVDPNTV